MKPNAAREALSHFLATAAIGLALTALSDVLPALSARQQALSPSAAGYAALSLLTALGMGLYSYARAHQAQLTADLAQAIDGVAPAGAASVVAQAVVAAAATVDGAGAAASGPGSPASALSPGQAAAAETRAPAATNQASQPAVATAPAMAARPILPSVAETTAQAAAPQTAQAVGQTPIPGTPA